MTLETITGKVTVTMANKDVRLKGLQNVLGSVKGASSWGLANMRQYMRRYILKLRIPRPEMILAFRVWRGNQCLNAESSLTYQQYIKEKNMFPANRKIKLTIAKQNVGVIPYIYDCPTNTIMQIVSQNDTKIVKLGTIRVCFFCLILLTIGIIHSKIMVITIGKGIQKVEIGIQAV